MPAPICQLLYCTTALFKVLYCKIKNVLFIFLCLFFMYYLCEKYYKPITVQYYIASCVSWVPRLTLLDLRTNWTYKRTLGTGLIHMSGTCCSLIFKIIVLLVFSSLYFRVISVTLFSSDYIEYLILINIFLIPSNFILFLIPFSWNLDFILSQYNIDFSLPHPALFLYLLDPSFFFFS